MTQQSKAEIAPLEGKVAGIINERELAINIGQKAGVRTGMVFKVMSDEPGEVTDPDSGELLGRFEREKVRVKVSIVHERFSVCRTFRARTIGGGWANVLGMMSERPREVVETLKADDASYIPPLSEEKSYVKKGDQVIQVVE